MTRNPIDLPLDDVSGIDQGRPETATDDSPQAQALSAEESARLEQAIASLDVDKGPWPPFHKKINELEVTSSALPRSGFRCYSDEPHLSQS